MRTIALPEISRRVPTSALAIHLIALNSSHHIHIYLNLSLSSCHSADAMAVFQSKKFRPSSSANTIASKYRASLARHPFALFGLPFIVTMVAGSFFLTPATAIRYEKHDRRVQRLSKEEELGIGKNARKVDMKEEYYVCGTETPWNGLAGRIEANSHAETRREGFG